MPRSSQAERTQQLQGVAILWMAVAALCLQIWLRFFAYGTYIDDAYIFMRYADNLREGHGLVYNLGEPVMGFTSPLFTLLLGGWASLLRFASIEAIVFALNLSFWAVDTWLIASLFRGRPTSQLLAVFLWCFYFPYTDAAVNGMETLLFLGGILSTFRTLQLEKWSAAAFFALLSVLIRPEGVLLALLAFAAILGRKRLVASLPGALAGLLAVGTWAGFATAYYGSPLPQSMLAKSVIATSGLADRDVSALDILRSFVFGVPSEAVRMAAWPVAALVALAGFVLALHASKKDAYATFYFALFGFFVAFYVFGKPTHLWSWYAIPPSVCLMLTFASGIEAWIDRWSRPARLVSSAATVTALGLLAVFGLQLRVERLQAFAHANRKLVRLIRDEYPMAESIMLGDIGIVGYETKARIVDLAGLVSRKTLRTGADGELLSYGAVIRRERPAVIAFRSDITATDSFEEAQVARRSFDDDSQRHDLFDNYVRIRFDNPYYPAVFVRMDVVPSIGHPPLGVPPREPPDR